MRELVIRIGTFFLVVGIGLLILFVASDLSQMTDFDYLFWAILAISVGLLLRGRRTPPPSSGRFRLLHKNRQDSSHGGDESGESRK